MFFHSPLPALVVQSGLSSGPESCPIFKLITLTLFYLPQHRQTGFGFRTNCIRKLSPVHGAQQIPQTPSLALCTSFQIPWKSSSLTTSLRSAGAPSPSTLTVYGSCPSDSSAMPDLSHLFGWVPFLFCMKRHCPLLGEAQLDIKSKI